MNSDGFIREIGPDNREEIMRGFREGTEVPLTQKQAQSLMDRSVEERRAAFRALVGGGKNGSDLKRLRRQGRLR